MSPTELAKTYMLSFFGQKPLADLGLLLSEDLNFTGPFYKFNTAKDYLESLDETMPIGAVEFQILKELERDNSCCLVYQSIKDGRKEIMAQLFEIEENKITRIRVILDATKLLDQ